MQNAYPLLQTFLAATMAYSCFCRMVHTDQKTIREIRWAFWFQCVAALIVLAAPWLPAQVPEFTWPVGTTPLPLWLNLALAVVLVQFTTSRHWKDGVPQNFKEPGPHSNA